MFTILIALAVSGGVFAALWLAAGWGIGWAIFAGLVTFGICQAIVGVKIQKRMKQDMDAVQSILMNGQSRIQEKMARWKFRPPGSIQEAQREIFNETKGFVHEAIKSVDSLNKYRGWVPLIDRQMATAKLQLFWMIKDFDAVDRYMPKAMFLDPTTVAMRIARMYMLNKPSSEIEPIYQKGVRHVRYNGNVLLAATWSWIQVKRGEIDGAFKTLTEALKKSDNEVLRANHEHLMNNRVPQFNNSRIGDQWYALFLEEPKIKTQRQHVVYR